MTDLSPTPLTPEVKSFNAYRTEYGPNRTAANRLVRCVLAEDHERSLAERDARIAELRENGDRLVAAADGWKADAIEWQEKHAALEARNAELVKGYNALCALWNRANAVLGRTLLPRSGGGATDPDAINQLHGIFDSPEAREAGRLASAALTEQQGGK